VPIGRSDDTTGKNSLYPLELAVASPEENLSTLWEKTWPHLKKLYVPIGSSDDLS
jgi:hypothetical protein